MVKAVDRWTSGETTALLHAGSCFFPTSGSVHLHGGGRGICPEDSTFLQFKKRFVEHGRKAVQSFFGGVNIVIVSTCGNRPDSSWQDWGTVVEISPKTRAEADAEHICDLIDSSHCIWFTGGDQGRLRGVLNGSATERAVQRLLERGGAVGGTSAGASILSSLCPYFDEIMEGLDVLQGACVLSHLLRRARQERLAETARCLPGVWGLGLDEGAGLVLTPDCCYVSCWSPVVVMLAKSGRLMTAVLQPGFQGSFQDLEHRMLDAEFQTWMPERAAVPAGDVLWHVDWSSTKAVAEGPVDTVATNATFCTVKSHHFLSWQCPSQESDQALVFASHAYLDLTFDLATVPLLSSLTLVHRTELCVGCRNLGYSPVDIRMNDFRLASAYDPAEQNNSSHQFVASVFSLPAGALRVGGNRLRLSSRRIESQYWLFSVTLVQLSSENVSAQQATARRESGDALAPPGSTLSTGERTTVNLTPRRGYLFGGPSSEELTPPAPAAESELRVAEVAPRSKSSQPRRLSSADPAEDVFLNIYDLGKSPTVQSLNGILKPVGGGAFHCAVQVYGKEWSFGGWPEDEPRDSGSSSGVWSCEPRQSKNHTFREAVDMGKTRISKQAVIGILGGLAEEWPMSGYHFLHRNCCHFCDDLCSCLGIGALPGWVKNLAGVGATLNQGLQVASSLTVGFAARAAVGAVSALTDSRQRATAGEAADGRSPKDVVVSLRSLEDATQIKDN